MGRGLDGFFVIPGVALCSFEGPWRAWSLDLFPVALARGKHLFPFRTEQLSPSAPMVLGSQGPGRVGRRRFFSRARAVRTGGPPPCAGSPCELPGRSLRALVAFADAAARRSATARRAGRPHVRHGREAERGAGAPERRPGARAHARAAAPGAGGGPGPARPRRPPSRPRSRPRAAGTSGPGEGTERALRKRRCPPRGEHVFVR